MRTRERERTGLTHTVLLLYRFSEAIVPEDGSKLSCWLLSDDDYHWERLSLELEEKVPYMST